MTAIKWMRMGNKHPGSVTTFLRKTKQGMARGEMSVPCGGCNSCCRSPNIYPDLRKEELKNFPNAEVHDDGKYYLPKNADGTCVHLINGKCSIYVKRPFSCRMYDCRWHVLLGFLPTEDPIMAEAIGQWSRFSMPLPEDEDVAMAIMLAVIDGGVPKTQEEHLRKAKNCGRYLKTAQRIREKRNALLAENPKLRRLLENMSEDEVIEFCDTGRLPAASEMMGDVAGTDVARKEGAA